MNIPEFVHEIGMLNLNFRDTVGKAEAVYAAGVEQAVISLTQGDENTISGSEKPYPVPRAKDYRN